MRKTYELICTEPTGEVKFSFTAIFSEIKGAEAPVAVICHTRAYNGDKPAEVLGGRDVPIPYRIYRGLLWGRRYDRDAPLRPYTIDDITITPYPQHSRQKVVWEANREAAGYILIDGVLWANFGVPYYAVRRFGSSYKDGGGARAEAFFYKGAVSRHDKCFFHIDRWDEAVEELNRIARQHGYNGVEQLQPDQRFEIIIPEVSHLVRHGFVAAKTPKLCKRCHVTPCVRGERYCPECRKTIINEGHAANPDLTNLKSAVHEKRGRPARPIDSPNEDVYDDESSP